MQWEVLFRNESLNVTFTAQVAEETAFAPFRKIRTFSQDPAFCEIPEGSLREPHLKAFKFAGHWYAQRGIKPSWKPRTARRSIVPTIGIKIYEQIDCH